MNSPQHCYQRNNTYDSRVGVEHNYKYVDETFYLVTDISHSYFFIITLGCNKVILDGPIFLFFI